MTDDTDRLAQIRARAEAATPGPWFSDIGNFMVWDETSEDSEAVAKEIGDDDCVFIAHSREDVPFVLDLVDSLTAERDTLRAVVEEARAAVAEGMAHYDRWVGAREMLKLLDRGLREQGE
jgi:hypothetical protein